MARRVLGAEATEAAVSAAIRVGAAAAAGMLLARTPGDSDGAGTDANAATRGEVDEGVLASNTLAEPAPVNVDAAAVGEIMVVPAEEPEAGVAPTPLWVASQEGHLEIVRYLVECAGADVNEVSHVGGCTPLIIAAHEGKIKIVEYLVRCTDIDVDCATPDGWTSAMIAASQGEGGLPVLKELAAFGADLSRGIQGESMARIAQGPCKDWIAGTLVHLTEYQIAAANANHAAMRWILKSGSCDPCETPNGTCPAGTLANDSLCELTASTARAANLPWCPSRHWLFPPRYRETVQLVRTPARSLWLHL